MPLGGVRPQADLTSLRATEALVIVGGSRIASTTQGAQVFVACRQSSSLLVQRVHLPAFVACRGALFAGASIPGSREHERQVDVFFKRPAQREIALGIAPTG